MDGHVFYGTTDVKLHNLCNYFFPLGVVTLFHVAMGLNAHSNH